MPEKKRKSEAKNSEGPARKQQKTKNIVVTHITSSDIAKPVVASLPGLNLPQQIRFKSFTRKHDAGNSDLLLQSSDHPTIDYSAVESTTINSADKHLKHYVAVFDPNTGSLQVTEAKRLAVRSCVRQLEPEKDSDESDADKPAVTQYSSRVALTEAFGTKRSKKAVQSIAENRLLAQGGGEDSALSNALLDAVDDEDFDTVEHPHGHRSNKPLPEADVDANNISQVYSLESLVFPHPPATTLEKMPLAYWIDRVGKNKDVKSHYRFIVHRVVYLTKAHLSDPSNEKIITTLQLLRYIQLLLEIARYVTTLPRFRAIPAPASWPSKATATNIPLPLLSQAVEHFFPNRQPTTHALMLLRSTILALTLHIPPPTLNSGEQTLITDPTDISLDLAVDRKEISKLYRELGCEMRAAKDEELAKWGLPKATPAARLAGDLAPGIPRGADAVVKFARLKFPIKFPTVSQGRRTDGSRGR